MGSKILETWLALQDPLDTLGQQVQLEATADQLDTQDQQVLKLVILDHMVIKDTGVLLVIQDLPVM